MRGLDPRIHQSRNALRAMDCRVKPGNDDLLNFVAHLSRPSLRIDNIAQTVAEQVETEHRDHQRQPRE
jgi:hypothetical protein